MDDKANSECSIASLDSIEDSSYNFQFLAKETVVCMCIHTHNIKGIVQNHIVI